MVGSAFWDSGNASIAPGEPDPNVTPGGGTAAPKTTGSQIDQWYNQYLGHGMGAGTPDQTAIWSQWAGMDPNAVEAGIKGSAEAQAYTAGQGRTKVDNPAVTQSQPSATGPVPTLQQPIFTQTAQPIASAQGANPALAQLRSLLMSRATQSENVDPNDPAVKAQTDAYAADVTRAGNSFLSKQAEKGGPYGDMSASVRSVGEKAGQATADYRGKLLQGIADARRQQISSALSGLGGTLSVDEATRLRQEDQDLARQQFGAGTAQQAFQDQYQTIFG